MTMTAHHNNNRAHWETIYGEKSPEAVSWRQGRPDLSIELIHRTELAPDATILDVGGGASRLVDHLLAEGRRSLVVLDIAETALARARERLGDDAKRVKWITADVTAWTPDTNVDFWHDRAVLHFLTERADQEAYFRALKNALRPFAWVMIAGFAPGGPTECSGLPVVRHDAESLQKLLGDDFTLTEQRDETHRTPSGSEQAFRYHLFRHSAGTSLLRKQTA